jgi:hypothetical protein
MQQQPQSKPTFRFALHKKREKFQISRASVFFMKHPRDERSERHSASS